MKVVPGSQVVPTGSGNQSARWFPGSPSLDGNREPLTDDRVDEPERLPGIPASIKVSSKKKPWEFR